MTSTEFFEQLELLKVNENLIPTEAFLDKFRERLPNEDDIPEEYLGRDAEDYHSWGYALYNDVNESGEELVNDLKLFIWMDFYDALEARDKAKMDEATEELFRI